MKQLALLYLVAVLLPLTTLPTLAQEWEPYNELYDLYPSALLAMSNVKGDPDDEANSHNLGDLNGLMGIHFKAARPNTRVRLTMTCTGGIKLFNTATVDVTVPNAGEDYLIAPVVPFDEVRLASVRQTQNTYVTYGVTVNGRQLPTRTERILVHPVNVCPFGVSHGDDDYTSTDFLFAAYVNEDHPQVDRILQEALRKKYVSAFLGYQGEKLDVYRQVMAIWRVLQERGIKYSSITTTVADNENVNSQHVRFIDESLNNTQANCVDGSVLFASVLRKIGIEPILVTIPGHMFVGFDLDEEGKRQAYLETTMLGTAPGEFEVKNTALARSLLGTDDDLDIFSIFGKDNKKVDIERFIAAIQTGGKTYADNKQGIEREHDDFSKLRVSEARQLGILPIMYVGKPVAGR